MKSIFKYNGNEICFRKEDGSVMVNATEMAKAFGKAPKDWLRNDSSNEFIDALSSVRQICTTDLVKVVQGGTTQGTWMHEDVALEFARWLSPAFAIWCNDRIKELMTNGYTKLDSITRKDLARMLYESEEAKEKLEAENLKQAKALQEAAPKVLFAESVMASKQSVLIRDLAKVLRQNGIITGQNRLFAKLRDMGYLCQWGESYNQPSQRSMEMGLFEIKKNVMTQPDGSVFVTSTPKVTPKGQIYFVNKFINGL